jgi:glycosyltransferase involved in cell wall biosynthesis
MPKVSVVIPAHNSSKFLAETIRSVLYQSFRDFEIIIIDDGSTDDTAKVASGFPVRYFWQENRGVSAARNKGIELSQGEYIAFLDSDDMWLPQKLELQLAAIENAPLAGVVYSDLYYYDNTTCTTTGTFLQKRRRPPPRGKVLGEFIEYFFGHPSTLLVRKNVFAQVGMFDETLHNCEDDDMLFRMASYCEFEVVPVPLVMYRMHDSGQKSREQETVTHYYILYLNKALQSPMLNDEMRMKLCKSLAERHFRYGELLIRRGRINLGTRELWRSIKADIPSFLSLILAFSSRIAVYTFALISTRAKVLWGRLKR